MRVLVTGGAGFIGSHLVERLVQDPARTGKVRVVDNLSTGSLENLRPCLERVEFRQGDLLDAEVREWAVRDIDVILHQAAIPSVPRSMEQPLESHRNGAQATLLLLDSARRHGVQRLVYAGSSSAYGDSEVLPKVETMAPLPRSPYAASKLAGELYAAAFTRCFGLDTVTLRYFNVFGPRQDPASMYSGVVARFCLAFRRNEALAIHGDGEQSRDFTYIENVVEANLLAARAPGPLQGQVINVACGERHTLNALVQALNELTGQRRAPQYGPARPGDVRHSLADISRARAILKYEPRVDFKSGLARTLAWYSA